MRIIIVCLFLLYCAIEPLCLAQQPEHLGQDTKLIKRTSPLKVGDAPPDFTLPDHNGGTVTLSAARNEKPVVLVFYRGYW